MAKQFSYNPTYNRLTAKGGTEIDPITFADLYAADQANGWNVVHYYTNNTYHLDCLLYLGDGSTSTYFIDKEKMVVFTDQITGNSVRLIYVNNNAHIQLGELVSEGNKETCKGCVIQSNVSALWTYLLDGGYTNTYRRLYSCTIISPNFNTKSCKIHSYDNTRLWNCNFVNYVWALVLGDAGIYRITLTGGTDTLKPTGFEGQYGSPTIDDYFATNLRHGIRAYTAYQDLKVSRMKATNETSAVVFDSQNYDAILVDCEFTNWIVYCRGVTETGKALRKYTVNIHMADKDGVDLSGVNIICKDKNNNEVFNVNTDVNGDITEQEVTYLEWYQLSGGYHGEEDATCFSPHKFIISKAGYESLEIDNITMDEPVKWHLELLPEVQASILRGTNFDAELEKDVNLSGEIEKINKLEAELAQDTNLEGTLQPRKDKMTGELDEDESLTGEI